jgi:hypothetical protein
MLTAQSECCSREIRPDRAVEGRIMSKAIPFIAAAALSLSCYATPAAAATIIDNPLNGIDGSCLFATTCGTPTGAADPFAAQFFTVSDTTALTGASFTAYITDLSLPFTVNWKILSEGSDGLPGAAVLNGSAAAPDQVYLGQQFGLSIVRSSFDIAGSPLASGSYYLAIQAVTTASSVYLANADGAGAAYSANGNSWAPGYGTASAVAVSLSGDSVAAVPEPTTWAMMIIGFGFVGLSLRRRRTATTMRVRFTA